VLCVSSKPDQGLSGAAMGEAYTGNGGPVFLELIEGERCDTINSRKKFIVSKNRQNLWMLLIWMQRLLALDVL
jgi:hypothetical protein